MAVRRIVMLDACLLINLLLVDRTDILAGLTGYDFRMTEMVLDEIRDYAQKAEVSRLREDGVLRLERVEDAGTLKEIDELCLTLGRGEASCIAIARRYGFSVGTDDRKASLFRSGHNFMSACPCTSAASAISPLSSAPRVT